MDVKHIKKSTVQTIVNKLKGRDPSISSVLGSEIADKISQLEMVQSINPTATLDKNNSSYTIPKGRNSGGTVSVVPQQKTATISTSTVTYSGDAGKVLTKLTVPALNNHPFDIRTLSPGSNATSVTISELSFKPVGIFINIIGSTSGSATKYAIAGVYCDGTTTNGIAEFSSTQNGVVITSASISTTSTSITLSNIKASDNGSCKFRGVNYYCVVWG